MKKIYLFLTLLLAFNFSFAQLLTEDFNYTAGQLITANGWTAHSGANTNAITVVTPGLTYTGHPGSGIGNAVSMTTSGEDDNKPFTAVNTGSVYFSFLANLSAAQTAGDYFIGLFQTSSIFPVRIYAKSDGAGGFYFGISKGASTVVYETTSRTFGTTYLVVSNYIFNTTNTTDDVINLWVNPTLGGPETAATIANVTGTSTDATSIAAAYLRQGTAANASTQKVDALLVGTTWASVTPGAAVPALSATSLTAFGNVCINTTGGPNSFTINGSNLTNADVNVAALTGYTYATTSGGSYSSTLTLSQAGGTYSQQVFVKFDPTAVQTYNGNIVVSGGGASSSVNVAASGAGINTAPTVTSGAASSISQNTATVAGSISSTGCSAVTAYGIEYSTTAGFPNGSGTAVPSTNLAGGNFSSDLAGLSPGVTYYYHAYATNGGGTTYGAELSFTTATPNPSANATALAAFGNVCINTTSAVNSFTLSGTNLTAANITVAALTGYSYATTVGGTYTSTLTLTQPGGTYSQEIFVKFTPTAVQSYNGNIVISGGGLAVPVNVAASGAGVNTTATITTGAASAITTTTATLAGSITANGCSNVTAYGIEYSTTNNFPTGTGTQVASTNIAGGNYTSALTGLTASTIYYYRAYATNAGGTSYGSQLSFTTAAPPPPVITTTAIGSSFGNVCVNTTAGPLQFTISGSNLTTANITVGPLTGYTFSETANGTFVTILSIVQTGGTQNKTVYVKFTPTAVQSYNGNIPVTGGGTSSTQNVAVTGSGVNTLTTVTTNPASVITANTAVLNGSTGSIGCSAITEIGFEYSTINGFADGTGTPMLANLSFSTLLNGLVPGATYYFKAYAKNAGGTAYGAQQSFTTTALPDGFRVYPVPAEREQELYISMKDLAPGYYGILFYNATGALVYQKNLNVQSNYIYQSVTVPGTLQRGVYTIRLVNEKGVIATRTIVIM